MITKVFSVFDSAVGAYLPPFHARSSGEAIRSFMDACNADGPFVKNAADYTLFAIAEFDDSAGTFSGGPPTRLMGALEAVVKSPT